MEKKQDKMRFKLKGITCRECASDMERILGEKEGIDLASVDYDSDTVEVSFDTEALKKKDVYFAVRKLGFKVDKVED
jgi:Cu+-exporting ATPase